MAMTGAALKQLCRQHNLYSTPELNDVLYCNFQGFTRISGLQKYTGLRSLFMEGNALTGLEDLRSCELKCLYVQSNQIDSLVGLKGVPHLRILNISSNQLSSLQGLDACPRLSTLNCANNLLKDISDLRECAHLETLDLQGNKLEDPQALEAVCALPALCSLYIKHNPFLAKIRQCRKTLIGSIPTLTYLDDRPVFDLERGCAEAWLKGGLDAEEVARQKHLDAARAQERDNFEALQAMRRESFQKRREALGLSPGDKDPFHDTVDIHWKEPVEEKEELHLEDALAHLAPISRAEAIKAEVQESWKAAQAECACEEATAAAERDAAAQSLPCLKEEVENEDSQVSPLTLNCHAPAKEKYCGPTAQHYNVQY